MEETTIINNLAICLESKQTSCGTENSENTETSVYPGRRDDKLTLEQGPVKSYPDNLWNSHQYWCAPQGMSRFQHGPS